MINRPAQLVLAVLGLAWASTAVFTVDAREVAVVTSFGAPIRSITEPGLQVKVPWPVQDVVRYDQRAQVLAVDATELLTKDKKNLVVAPYCVWRVQDPQKFLEAVTNLDAAEVRLRDLVKSQIAAALGQVEFNELFSTERVTAASLSEDVVARIRAAAGSRLGVEVLDVQLEHVGLPVQNEQSIYERMRAERSRIANAYRSEGEERATEIRAQADRAAAELLANADKQARAITSEAEGDAAAKLAEAYRKDPELFKLLKGIETMEVLLDGETTLVLDAKNDPVLREVLNR